MTTVVIDSLFENRVLNELRVKVKALAALFLCGFKKEEKLCSCTVYLMQT